jgi:hypothetical protein
MVKYLVYYTHGYNLSYLQLLKLSLLSLRLTNRDEIDVLILCDKKYVNLLKKISNISILSLPDSNSPEEASMHKLNIFSYPKIYDYDAVIFIDSDILIKMDLKNLLDKVTRDNVIYVCNEKNIPDMHKGIWHSLSKYTDEEYKYLIDNKIQVFNAGCFLFRPSKQMKKHFDNLLHMIKNHKGNFFYEQSFMNHYFNLNGKTDRTLLTEDNYILFPKSYMKYENALLHFCGNPGYHHFKEKEMNESIKINFYLIDEKKIFIDKKMLIENKNTDNVEVIEIDKIEIDDVEIDNQDISDDKQYVEKEVIEKPDIEKKIENQQIKIKNKYEITKIIHKNKIPCGNNKDFVIFTNGNGWYIDTLIKNLLISFEKHENKALHKVIVFCTDQDAVERCKKNNFNYCYVDIPELKVSELKDNTNYNEEFYTRLCFVKTVLIRHILNLDIIPLYLDPDMSFVKPSIFDLFTYLSVQKPFVCSGIKEHMNSNIMLIYPCNYTKALFLLTNQDVEYVINNPEEYGDEDVLRPRMAIFPQFNTFIDQEKYPTGCNAEKNKENVYIFHANCFKGLKAKIDFLKRCDAWYLE